MQKMIQKVEFNKALKPKVLRVAAYTRVSSEKDAMLHSLSQQISYYSELIQMHNDWLYCGVYADEALTGTKDNRADFKRLISDCRAGKIDLIITKSISRFARNTVTLLETVRELKLLGVGVFFEEQNINTLTADGELMLTILASYAQEESLTASENQKWRIRNDYKNGILPLRHQNIYGYKRTDDCGFEIVPEEADVIRTIFKMFLEGNGTAKILKYIQDNGIPSNTNEPWTKKKVRYILSNEKYAGNLLLQKYFVADHLTKRNIINRGELPQYYVADNHEAIIPREIYDAVQLELQRRKGKYCKEYKPTTSPFSKKIQCGICGKSYRRKITATRVVWLCSTFDAYGKKKCASKQIPDDILRKTTTEVLGINEFDVDLFKNYIEKIIVPSANHLTFVFKDGHTEEKVWQHRSRSKSWTDEMKEQARQKSLQRRKNNG